MDYYMIKDGVMNGWNNGVMVGYNKPLGSCGYLLLRYAQGDEGRHTWRLLPLYGAA